MVAADSVLQVADARPAQPGVCLDSAGRSADGADVGHHHPVEFPRPGSGLPAAANGAGDVADGVTAVDCAAVGGGAVQPALGRLPLGPGDWLEHAGAVLCGQLAPDVGVDPG